MISTFVDADIVDQNASLKAACSAGGKGAANANASADHTNSACVRAVGGDAELAAAPALAPTMTPTKTSASATALLQA